MRVQKPQMNQGYLTVYLALIMTVLLSLYLALIEGARSNAIRLEAECIADIGLNSVLAEYHRELYKQYNLFAIDTSYGTNYATSGNVEKHLQEYMNRNMSTEDILGAPYSYKDFLAMSVGEAELTRVSCLTDRNGAVFRRRAVEAIKDDVGLSLMEELGEWTRTVSDYQMKERDIADEKKEIDEEIEEYDGSEVQVSEEEWVTVDIENPTDNLEQIRNTGILQMVVENPQQLSTRNVATDVLIGSRMEAGEITRGNWEEQELTETDQWIERFFFQEYLIKYMGRYGNEDENNALNYQLEYLVTGENNDMDNLRKTAETLCAIREVANAAYLFSDPEKCAAAELMAASLAFLMLVPQITELLKGTILLGWAYAESIYDVKTLLKGGRIPLIKDDNTWHYGLEDALQLKDLPEEDSGGLSYEDYLRVLMCFTDLDTLTVRAMDMVEADIRKTPGNEAFRLDACYDCIETRISVESAYGYKYEIIGQKKY